MPRKLRNPKARRGTGVPVSEALFSYLVWGDWERAAALAQPGESKWQLFDGVGAPSHEMAWHSIVEDALTAWTQVYPGSRPENWWRWSAPELRRIFGRFTVTPGLHRCQDTGIPYGSPDDWTDLPMVESEPAFLDRFALWLPGERERVPVAAFDAQPFSWDLTHHS